MRIEVRAVIAFILLGSCITACYCKDHGRAPICAAEGEFLAKNQLHINEVPVNVTIGTGRRATDRILAFMLLHFIYDSIGYPAEVVTYEYTPQEWVKHMNCDVDKGEDCKQTPMLHIGVVETTDQFPLYRGKVSSAGYLGVSIKLGWFVTTDQVDNAGSGPSPDHYRYFTFENLASTFSLEEKDYRDALKRPGDSGTNWCDKKRYTKCDSSGLYIPERCTKKGLTCATLLAAFPYENYDVITTQIEELKLFVKVAWVGNRLDGIVQRKLLQGKPILIFDYSVSPLTVSSDTLTEVLFPSCNTLGEIKGCIYPNAKLKKLYWNHLDTAAPQVVKLLKKADFRVEEFTELVKDQGVMSASDEKLQQLACSFARNLNSRWSQGVDIYPMIYIHTILPKDDNSLREATATAINRINREHLKDVILNPKVVDGQCSRENILKEYITDITLSGDQYVGVIGPDCNRSLESLIGVAEHYKHVVFSYSVDTVIDDVTRNQNFFFRIPPDTSVLARAYVRFIKDMKWVTFAAFTESSYQSSAYIDDIRLSAQSYSQTLLGPFSYTRSQIREKLISMKSGSTARIIIGDFPEKVAGKIMCEAFKLNMTARDGYVWLLPFWINDHSFECANDEKCTLSEMQEAVEYSFKYKFRELADEAFNTDYNGETVREWKDLVTKNYTFPLDEHAGFAYDAVWALGTSLGVLSDRNRTFLEKLRSPSHETSSNAFRQLAQKIKTSEFRGVSGFVKFNRTLRQPDDVTLYQYRNGSWEHVGTFFTNGSDTLPYTNIRWYNNVHPTDGTPACAFQSLVDALGVSCDGAHILAISGMFVGALVFMGGVAASFAYRHYEKKMRTLEQNQGPVFTLDEYQLPEESVRIYRQVGEGAFGTVYFGDFIDDEKNLSQVAVKAAKDPKNLNSKLELLTEAEVMKELDHNNILRLIGVIVKPDKCHIVTEFMMFGNLKNYLQDRRHLVARGEIGAALLTQMASDICRGLVYLASLNYVHGDLACRNCLVHENLTIKIADFGFCKNLVDQGYYRIVRTGPMPVRWMSPELLQTGVYHKESDIWSFGIVLFEIITLGAYPYHDRNDRDVQEFIRKGGFPTLPQRISSDLEALLLRIWSLDKDDRPDAQELYDCLAAKPDLVHPCIEEGAMMNAESLERFSRGSSSHGSMNWTNRNRVRGADSYLGSASNRIASMKIV